VLLHVAAALCGCRYEGPKSTNPLSFRYYNADEVVAGKKMKDWCVAREGGKQATAALAAAAACEVLVRSGTDSSRR
jgi:hypothetical protein